MSTLSSCTLVCFNPPVHSLNTFLITLNYRILHRHKLLKIKCIKIVLKCTSCVSIPYTLSSCTLVWFNPPVHSLNTFLITLNYRILHRHKLLKIKCIKIALKCTSCVSIPYTLSSCTLVWFNPPVHSLNTFLIKLNYRILHRHKLLKIKCIKIALKCTSCVSIPYTLSSCTLVWFNPPVHSLNTFLITLNYRILHRHKLLKIKCIKIVLKCTSCVSIPYTLSSCTLVWFNPPVHSLNTFLITLNYRILHRHKLLKIKCIKIVLKCTSSRVTDSASSICVRVAAYYIYIITNCNYRLFHNLVTR